jgi:hypothetical protein
MLGHGCFGKQLFAFDDSTSSSFSLVPTTPEVDHSTIPYLAMTEASTGACGYLDAGVHVVGQYV